VEGVALAELTDDAFAVVGAALLDHHVLFFRDQFLSESAHLAVAERWGTPMRNPVAALVGVDRVISPVEDTADRPPDADNWHTDITYWPIPPKIAVLCALEVPPLGGDTLWLSLFDVCDALSVPMKRMCEGLAAFHCPTQHFIEANVRSHGLHHGDAIRRHLHGTVHPLVRTHEQLGRNALFLSSFIDHLVDIPRSESDALLAYFNTLLTDPNRSVRWQWREGDVAVWDERCTNHRALGNHYPQHRLMRRCTVEGPRPVFIPHDSQASTVLTAVG
jgi:taurine dioxygenase